MDFNVQEINRILNDIDFNNPDDYEYSSACWKDWVLLFFLPNKKNSNIQKESLIEQNLIYNKFLRTQATEEDFKAHYPNIVYKEYISPWFFNHKMVSKKKVSKIAFELQEHLSIEYAELCHLLLLFYSSRDSSNWNFDNLSICLMSYNKELYMKTQIYLALNSKAS